MQLHNLSCCNSVDYSFIKSLYLPRYFCTQFAIPRCHSKLVRAVSITVDSLKFSPAFCARIFILWSRSQSAAYRTQDVGGRVKGQSCDHNFRFANTLSRCQKVRLYDDKMGFNLL